jgi:hypothetical protein
VKPHFSQSPIPRYSIRRDFQYFRRLIHGQACKKTQLDDAHDSRVHGRKRFECIIKGNQVCSLCSRHHKIFVEPDRLHTASSLQVVPPSAEIHQNPPHQLSRHTQKVCSILPLHMPDIDQLQVDLIDERRGLKRMLGPLSCHVTAGHGVQLPVNHGQELLER